MPGKYMDDEVSIILRHMQRIAKLHAEYTGPQPRDNAAIAKQAREELAQEDRDAVYYPAESTRGCSLRDTVLAIEELLAQIFVHCLPRMPLYQCNRPSPLWAPMLLAQVSRRWRRVALSTPRLWTSYTLLNQFNLSLFRLWMERSGASPLSLYADHDSLEVVFAYSRRFGSLNLDLEPSSIPFLAAIRDKVPRLYCLYIEFPKGTPLATRSASPCDAFEYAPNLRSVLLKRPAMDFKLPSSQLEQLTIFNAPGDFLVRACHGASSLTKLYLAAQTIPADFLDMPLCNLVHLKEMWAYDVSRPEFVPGGLERPTCKIATLLSKFCCPALDKVNIGSLPRLLQSDHASFQSQISSFLTCSPRITKLKITDLMGEFYEDIILAILAHCPALEKFETRHHSEFSAAFFKRLTYVAGVAPLCPRLRSFNTRCAHALESAPAFVEMVASRWRVVDDDAVAARLQAITFSCHHPSCTATLDGFAAEGLALTCDYWP
ncbi:hypothetical protein B0H16DRAFT_1726062 [Mycena metata]|uniref:F-box domain-containing protein n=1 Tax=Mycena metata TaxID=1033252 RepID=A0AAD7N6A1_9AGAR|nr:hypothetical protein B0H16DRAFT_1726062 [Mycena metata]